MWEQGWPPEKSLQSDFERPGSPKRTFAPAREQRQLPTSVRTAEQRGATTGKLPCRPSQTLVGRSHGGTLWQTVSTDANSWSSIGFLKSRPCAYCTPFAVVLSACNGLRIGGLPPPAERLECGDRCVC